MSEQFIQRSSYEIPLIHVPSWAGALLGAFSAPNSTPPVRIVISTAKATYAPGVPIVLTIVMDNVSNVPIKVAKVVAEKQAELDYNIVVKDTSSRLVERSRYGQAHARPGLYAGSLQSLTLEPGSTLSEKSIITKLYHLSAPGKYTVTAKREFYYSTGAHQYKSAVAHSNKITFSIAP